MTIDHDYKPGLYAGVPLFAPHPPRLLELIALGRFGGWQGPLRIYMKD